MSTAASGSAPNAALAVLRRLIDLLDRVPYSALAVPLRLAVATVFWNSAMTKLDDWNAAVTLFAEEYKVPLLPPEVAAYIAVSVELSMPVLLLLGMTTVIEVFVYPQAWPTHIQWAAMLLVLLCRGPGALSLDHLLWRRLAARSSRARDTVSTCTDSALASS